MKPVVFRFYRQTECLGPDGRVLDLRKVASLRPLISIRARPEAVFRTHLRHLGFEISRHHPSLGGQCIPVELRFVGKDCEPKVPVLVATHRGTVVGKQVARLRTLDTTAFLVEVLRRMPEVKGEELVFTVNPDEGGHHEG